MLWKTKSQNMSQVLHSLIAMLEKWKKALHKEENMSAIFMDLSQRLLIL